MLQSAGKNHRLAGERRRGARVRRGVLDFDQGGEVVQHLAIVRFLEELAERLGDRRPDAIDRIQLLARLSIALGRGFHGGTPPLETAIVAGKQARVGLAHVTDAERIDEPGERNAPARLDRPTQVFRLLLAPQRQRLELLQALRVLSEAKQIAGLFDQTRLEQLRYLLAPQALDVERLTADEMAQALGDLRRADEAAGAAAHRLAGRSQREAAARRAMVRELDRASCPWAIAHDAPRPPAG